MNNQLNKEYADNLDLEIKKIKYLQSFDEVIGISDMNELEVLSYIQSNPVSNITLLSDEQSLIPKQLHMENRFECILNQGNFESANEDPTLRGIAIEACLTLLFFVVLSYLIYNLPLEQELRTQEHERKLLWKVTEYRSSSMNLINNKKL